MRAGIPKLFPDFDPSIRFCVYPIQQKSSADTTDYKHLFRESPLPMYVFDAETFQILEVNTSALLQYGYTRREFLALTAFDIRPAQDANSFVEINKKIPPEYFDAGRWRHKTKTGEIFYVQVYSHRTDFEGRAAIIALAINIDKQVRNEIK